MKFDIFKTRRGKLKEKINSELTKNIVNLDKILDYVEEYEKDNLDTINYLRKDKIITTKRINGAIRQCINSHGVITKELTGSLSKRIYGALLDSQQKPKSYNTVRILVELVGIIYILYTLWG